MNSKKRWEKYLQELSDSAQYTADTMGEPVIPMIPTESIEDFLDRCEDQENWFYPNIKTKEDLT